MATYKVGDVITIRHDFKNFNDLDRFSMEDGTRPISTNSEMRRMAGKISTIVGLDEYGRYHILGSGWHWTDLMFEESAFPDAPVDVEVYEYL